MRWDILADSLALFAQSSDVSRLQEALVRFPMTNTSLQSLAHENPLLQEMLHVVGVRQGIIERLRADPELETPVGEAYAYLLNLESMLAVKVCQPARQRIDARRSAVCVVANISPPSCRPSLCTL